MDRVTQIKWQMKITNYVNCECEKINMGDFIHKIWPVNENLDVKHNKNERSLGLIVWVAFLRGIIITFTYYPQ